MKKLIVLATLAALPAVAMADVTISGNIGVGVDNTKTGKLGSINTASRLNGNLKFSGSEDLGNGLKAIWQLDNRFDPSGNEVTSKIDSNAAVEDYAVSRWASRDTFVGLQAGFGKVVFGRVSNPTNSGFSGNADVFQVIGLHGDGSYKAGEDRLNSAVRFDSAEVSGFKVAVVQQLKNSTYTSGDKSTNGQVKYGSGVGISYATGPVTLIYSGTNYKNAKGKKVADEAAGAKFKTNAFTAQAALGDIGLNFGYGDSKSTTAAGVETKKRGYGVSATYALGSVTPAIGFWKQNAAKVAGVSQDNSYNVVSLGVDYALSKRTNAGVEFQKQSEGKTGAQDQKRIGAVYLNHSF